ncbi:MAG: Ribulose-phosphate 3-epimerase [Candidatus Woesebacteria bacterium GW2011_GWA1_37_8]|uniref:Ribulose-phosphate 3-epimerase n=1 Tax=Candidatus Woesebacteria bacterium GW2011_GWA1_37_8 TaxID=1618546 RepID=A0A0G0HLE1_9BACT|nr:MAG: hypothetical protein US39_C0012G0072 [Microgenomates group bacterium GW2011_GWC1_37_12b]KKQ43993.1 MAG: Ribulose-phosphate 3-epimerase [Candidatus Woesebacteria bacterium GW2011_GWA1_37_8]
MIKIIPAVLTNDKNTALEQIRAVEGIAERVSIDIIDGRYAENKTIDPLILADFNSPLVFDYQLMVYEPINWIDKCVSSHADRIIGHVEFMNDQKDFITKVKESGAKPGLGLDLNTPLEKIQTEVFGHISVLLLMSVKAGFSSQKFDESVYKKIEQAMQLRVMNNFSFSIQIDGGVDKEIAKKLDVMGVEEVSITSKVFQGNPSFNLNEINTYLSQP